MLKGFVSHDGAEIGAADADVDHIPDALAGVAFPVTATNAVRKPGHPVEDFVDLGHDIFAVHVDHGVPGRAESNVQDCAVLGEVDLFTAEHGINSRAKSAFCGQLQQQLQSGLGNAVFGVVKEQARCFGSEPFATFAVFGEKVSQLKGFDLFGMIDQQFPGGTFCEWLGFGFHRFFGAHPSSMNV